MTLQPLELEQPALFDTAVWSWVRDKRFPQLAEWFNTAVADGLVLISDPIAIELLRAMPNYEQAVELSESLDAFERLPISPITFSEARDIQLALAKAGQHRRIPAFDLVHATTAINSCVPLVHYDRDFDLLSAASGLDARWFVPPGSLAA